MPDPNRITTKRLTLVPATVELVEADFNGHAALANFLAAEVPRSWPPEYFDDSARRWLLVALGDGPHKFLPYYILYAVERKEPLLIGTCGFKGKPKEGVVEIGYGLVPEWQHKGIGTELVDALTRFAFTDPSVAEVCAHTLEELIPSQRVLEKNGFRRGGVPLEEGAIRYHISRGEFNMRTEKNAPERTRACKPAD